MGRAFENVNTGDTLILNGMHSKHGVKRAVTAGRTPKQIVIGERRFDLDGAQIGGEHEYWLSHPKPGEVERLKQADDDAREAARVEERRKHLAESSPELLAAEYLTGLGAWTADELLKQYDPVALIAVARKLKQAKK